VNNSAARIAIIPMVTSSSSSVNPNGSQALLFMVVGQSRTFRLTRVKRTESENRVSWKVERVRQRVMLVETVLRDGGRVRVLRLNGTIGTNATNGTNECVMEVWALGDGDNGKLQMADGKRDDG
jgi:hypothetical protein